MRSKLRPAYCWHVDLHTYGDAASKNLRLVQCEAFENHGTEAIDNCSRSHSNSTRISKSATGHKGVLILTLPPTLGHHCLHHPLHLSPRQRKIARFSLHFPLARSHTSFTHIIDTAPTAHMLHHTNSFMHQRVHTQGINCIYIALYIYIISIYI